MKSYLWILAFCCLPILATEPTFVYLVRHAEKVDASRDADLSQKGFERAKALAGFFEKIPLDACYATQYQRTQKTLEPLAEIKELKLQIVDAGTPQDQVDKITKEKGTTVIIAGHSNTLPELIERFGGPPITIGDDDYDNLFLLVLTETNVKLQQFRFHP